MVRAQAWGVTDSAGISAACSSPAQSLRRCRVPPGSHPTRYSDHCGAVLITVERRGGARQLWRPHLLLLMREGDSEEPKPNCLKKSNGSCRSCRAFASKPASPCISYFRRFSSSESTCRRVYRARACGRAGRSPNLIRIGYRRKLLCGACVAVLVRMILQRHLAIRLLQLRRIRIPGHAKFLQASVGALHNSARETQTS